MTKQYIIGSVSSGTKREEDLIPAFLDALEQLNPERAEQIKREWTDTIAHCDEEAYFEDASTLLNECLFDALNCEAPPYFYFGSHPGDGCDYGFWLVEDLNQQVLDNGGLVVANTSLVPDDWTGEVLHVNDHGNATLYTADNGKLTEVWSVV